MREAAIPIPVARPRLVECPRVQLNERVELRSRVVVGGDPVEVHLHELLRRDEMGAKGQLKLLDRRFHELKPGRNAPGRLGGNRLRESKEGHHDECGSFHNSWILPLRAKATSLALVAGESNMAAFHCYEREPRCRHGRATDPHAGYRDARQKRRATSAT